MTLIPCRYCGGHAVYMRKAEMIGHDAYLFKHACVCTACLARGPVFYESDQPVDQCRELAIAGWNSPTPVRHAHE